MNEFLNWQTDAQAAYSHRAHQHIDNRMVRYFKIIKQIFFDFCKLFQYCGLKHFQHRAIKQLDACSVCQTLALAFLGFLLTAHGKSVTCAMTKDWLEVYDRTLCPAFVNGKWKKTVSRHSIRNYERRCVWPTLYLFQYQSFIAYNTNLHNTAIFFGR